MNNRILTASLLTVGLCSVASAKPRVQEILTPAERPNIIVIYCDDMGYGDLSCNGNPTIVTPNIDRMAAEGQKWTNFYVSASVSSPSRGGLLTGRYGVRTGLYGDKRRVLQPPHKGGIQPEEITIGEYLQSGGYTTACVGKWHIGHQEGMLPRDNGFDYYFGIPYSNDMSVGNKLAAGKPSYAWELPLYDQSDDHDRVEYEPDQTQFTKRFTNYALDFIKDHQKEPFFLYLAHPMPHVPLHPSAEFVGHSERGIYGDAVEEIDYNVGRILDYLRESKMDKNTIVVFSSDNGPWLLQKTRGGSEGPFSYGKSAMFEGGFRVPAIYWGAGVAQGVVTDMGSTLDFLPTFCSLANVELKQDRVYDGFDVSHTISGEQDAEREIFYYYRGGELNAIRKGEYKLHVKHTPKAIAYDDIIIDDPLPWLYNVKEDVRESYNIAESHLEVIKELQDLINTHIDSYIKAPSQFDRGV